ncbi:TIGR04282 family arsenosugar biosynthesis glycosyltransferase [Thalassobellus suaedae]|uniref:TIGR04282 family arsenosugar biosynthesis glycosyltransferase n=1 Tax=Thalassobellus suaedae TaxID=3074124 RepID=A0ABY9Y5D4_9FLAO|nr:TIGR04282 family arsenosugar biosynthesis glycosyltransferase [Flavobacteriaceae bacterium HL-DH10]
MNKELVIIFVKNIKLGKVKTRLAKTIGNLGAFEVYSELVKITETATSEIKADKRIYFSDTIMNTTWNHHQKFIQEGDDLGTRMKNAFLKGFNDGFERIVLIGSDLPDISALHIENAIEALNKTEVVFGPAEDGGYYLIGLNKMHSFIFENKPWSQSNLLEKTCLELDKKNIKFTTLVTLNDIDTFEDLTASSFYKSNLKLQQRIQQLND